MNTRSIGYNNVAYCNQYEGGGGNERSFERDGDAVQHYQSYNETFVDDETCIQNFNQENQCMSDYEQQLPVGENSKLNRCFSTGNSPRNRLSESFSTNNGPRHKLNEPFLTNNSSRNRLYESFSVGNGSRNIQNESFSIDYSPRNKQNEYFPVDNCPRSRQTESFPVDNYARNRQNESFSIGNGNRSIKNESFSTDNCSRNRPYESFSVDNCPKSRPNESFSIGNSTRKSSRRERSSSAPGRRNTTEVLAPIIAQCQDFPTIRRSRSTIRLPRDSNVLSPTLQRRHSKSNSTKTISAYPQNSRNVYSEIASYPIPQRSMVPNIVAIKSERLHSFENYYDQEVGETSLLSTDLKRRVTPNRKPSSNLAVIPPNCRNVNNSAVPLLTHSPAKFQTRDSDFSDRSSPTKGSWLHLPSQHGGTESLWFAGMILLLTGFAICVLCFFLLSKKRKNQSFFFELGAVSGFVSFSLGFLGFRTNSWDWLPNRNYVSGYIILILLNLLQCGVLSILASGWKDTGSPEEDIASGAIGGLAVLTLLLSILGLSASTCCKNPPPDNRVAHCAQGFIV